MAATSMVEPVCTSYTKVFESLLALWRANSVICASLSFTNMARRMFSMPRLAVYDRAYCATKPASPRTPNKPSSATGTIQRSILPWAKPRSSKVLSRAGMRGSVSAPMSVATAAKTMPVRAERK